MFLWLTVKVGKARREVATNTQRTLADMTTITEETLSVSGILLSKAFGRQRFESDRFRGERASHRLPAPPDDDRPVLLRARGHVLLDHARPRVPRSRLGQSNSGSDVIAARMLVGFTTLQSRLFFPIGSMLQVSTEVQSSLALFDRIFEYLDLLRTRWTRRMPFGCTT